MSFVSRLSPPKTLNIFFVPLQNATDSITAPTFCAKRIALREREICISIRKTTFNRKCSNHMKDNIITIQNEMWYIFEFNKMWIKMKFIFVSGFMIDQRLILILKKTLEFWLRYCVVFDTYFGGSADFLWCVSLQWNDDSSQRSKQSVVSLSYARLVLYACLSKAVANQEQVSCFWAIH